MTVFSKSRSNTAQRAALIQILYIACQRPVQARTQLRLTRKQAVELVDTRRDAEINRLVTKVDDHTTQYGRVDLETS